MNWKKAFKGSLLVTGLVFVAYYLTFLLYEFILKYLSGGIIDLTFLISVTYHYLVELTVFGAPLFGVFVILFAFLLGILKLVYDILFPEAEEKPKKKKEKKKPKPPEEEEMPPLPSKREEEIPPPIPIQEFQSFQSGQEDWY